MLGSITLTGCSLFGKKKQSSEPEVYVDDDGNVVAVKEGTTKIIATIGNETWGYRDVSATLIVGVIVTYLEEQERLGNILLIYPQDTVPIGRTEQDEAKMRRVYAMGRAKAEEMLSEIKAFV